MGGSTKRTKVGQLFTGDSNLAIWIDCFSAGQNKLI
jgi:hypothetical protein